MASPSTVPATPGELLFKDYLDAMGYPYEFEKEFPGKKKRPDYAIGVNGITLLDVKDFEVFMPMGFSAFDPYPRIREKIEAGREKFKEFKDYPCALVLRNLGNVTVNLEDPSIMLGSMYGDAGFHVPVWTGDGPMPAEKPDLVPAFLGRGKMIRPKHHQNTTISALITLRYVGVGSGRLDKLFEERRRAEPSFGKENTWDALQEIYEECEKRYPNYDPNERKLGVIVWENAVARLSLSRDLFTGPYDERWGYEDGRQRIVFRGNELAHLR